MAGMKELHALGQSIWLDYIRRSMVRGGELRELIAHGLRGLTSNPSIFEKAISGGIEYEDDLRSALQNAPDTKAAALFERLAITDIREAADQLRRVWDESEGRDGFVSLEVSPHLAHDTATTIAEAHRLWDEVGRPNLMIKVPATPEGVTAIAELIGAGINVNATLMFSLAHYEAVARAYLAGLDRVGDPRRIASVASFFVSRIDGVVDPRLDAIGTPEAAALRGKAAVANAKMAYQRFLEIFHGEEFEPYRRHGARVQRVLFGSTSTKDPTYSDVKYVEELIGPDTVNTVPPATIEAFIDHGKARITLTEGIDAARRALAGLSSLGIDLDTVTEDLQVDGVVKFADSFDELMATLETKREQLLQPAS